MPFTDPAQIKISSDEMKEKNKNQKASIRTIKQQNMENDWLTYWLEYYVSKFYLPNICNNSATILIAHSVLFFHLFAFDISKELRQSESLLRGSRILVL